MAAGLASSAAAFAALTLAGCAAAGLELGRQELSALARRGSGSASRSIYGGFVELVTGTGDVDNFALPLAAPEHWPIVDLIVLTDQRPKPTGSTEGHSSAQTSPLQAARVSDAPRRLQACREAVLARDFERLAEVVEQDSDMLHAVMMTSSPPLHYWQPSSLAVMAQVRWLRAQGVSACYTVDAGPNVHCLCLPEAESSVREGLARLPLEIGILRAVPGPGAWLV
jgi:diphosphomevalonate decarboxylase